MTVATVYVTADATGNGANTSNVTQNQLSVFSDSKSGFLYAIMYAALSSIPANAVVTAATFNVYFQAAIGAGIYGSSRLTSNWGEVEGGPGPSVGAAVNTFPGTSGPAFSSMNILALAQGWINGTIPNYGLTVQTQVSGNGATIWTREASPGLQPYFQITYASAPGAPGAVTVPVSGTVYNESIALSAGQASDVDTPQANLTYTWEFSSDGGATWPNWVNGSQAAATTAAGTTAKVWNTSALPPGNNYRVRVRSFDGTNWGPYSTSGIFSIIHTSKMKVWSGAAWILRNLSRWDGAAWHTTKLKRWNGTTWIDV